MQLTCRDLSKRFGAGETAVEALARVNFTLGEREILCIVGPSGCGKSTLLRLLAGLLAADEGSIATSGANGNGRPSNALVFQEHGLFPWMNVVDNVAFGLRMAGVAKAESAARAREFLARIGLARFAPHYPRQLSVGMRQRVNLARALIVDPQLLLMDEPFAALDAQTRLLLQSELLESFEQSEKSVVYVTHDIEEALLLGDRVLVMSGRPGTIRDEIRVPLARPRNLLERGDPRLVELERRIWTQLESEVRRSFEQGAAELGRREGAEAGGRLTSDD